MCMLFNNKTILISLRSLSKYIRLKQNVSHWMKVNKLMGVVTWSCLVIGRLIRRPDLYGFTFILIMFGMRHFGRNHLSSTLHQ